jgi:hypothetical protein
MDDSFGVTVPRALDDLCNPREMALLVYDMQVGAYDYLRRTGRVSHADVRRRDPALAAAYEALHPEEAPP